MATYKTYRKHNCTRRHRKYHAFADCAFSRNLWVSGEGEFASVSWCGGQPSVVLLPTAEEAEDVKVFADQYHCGHACTGRHEIIRLDMVGV